MTWNEVEDDSGDDATKKTLIVIDDSSGLM